MRECACSWCHISTSLTIVITFWMVFLMPFTFTYYFMRILTCSAPMHLLERPIMCKEGSKGPSFAVMDSLLYMLMSWDCCCTMPSYTRGFAIVCCYLESVYEFIALYVHWVILVRVNRAFTMTWACCMNPLGLMSLSCYATTHIYALLIHACV